MDTASGSWARAPEGHHLQGDPVARRRDPTHSAGTVSAPSTVLLATSTINVAGGDLGRVLSAAAAAEAWHTPGRHLNRLCRELWVAGTGARPSKNTPAYGW